MMEAVCINCGSEKKRPERRCPVCSFAPSTDEEKAKSLMISVYYEPDDAYDVCTPEELVEASKKIAAGEFHFDDREVAHVVARAQEALAVPASKLVADLFRWMGPPILILLVVFLLLKFAGN